MKTSSTDSRLRRIACLAGVLLVTACAGDAPVTPKPSTTTCGGVSVSVRTLAPFEHVVLSGAEAACFALAGDNAEYLVVPQLTGATLPYGGYGFRLGDPNAVIARVQHGEVEDPAWVRVAASGVSDPPPDAQARLDGRMRARELAPGPARSPDESALLRGSGARTSSNDTLRSFSVLNTLEATPAYTSVRARLRFAGTRVLLYVDTLAATAFSDAELQGMGTLYDQRLAPAVTTTFGDGSDIDGNNRVIFLLTPTVNAMVTASQCGVSGFVRGFFYNHDLRSSDATSNRGEVFYAYVPDETGRWSCAHTKADVFANLPPTFVHELQHMLSYGEHAIERNGTAEEVWLNEALSHMAEEIGSLSYETRFPAPSGRSNPASIFPDSATPFINPNLLYSYRYLFSSATYSITSCAPGTFCSLAERGGTWLLLRWIADQHGATTLRRLVETSLTGRANLEAVTGQSTGSLLGTFALAVSADSVVGLSRTAAPAPLRFSSRNLRRVYKALFDAFGIIGGVGRPFPIEPLPLGAGASVTGTMRPGTFLTYRMRVSAGTPSAVVRLVGLDETPFPATSGAQVSILRMP
jgi:hypothetical protein